jgi:hypothetical protein
MPSDRNRPCVEAMPDTVKFLASVLTKHTISMASANKLSSIFIDMCQQVEQRHKLSVRDVHHLAVCGTLSDIAHPCSSSIRASSGAW